LSRRFYLPPRRSQRAVPKNSLWIGTVPRWIKIALPLAAGLLAVLYIVSELDFCSFHAAPGARTQVGSAIQPESTVKPADILLRPTDEENAGEAVEREVLSSPQNAEKPIRLQVLNGCGVKGLARIVSPALRAKGFDVRETRNAGSFRYTQSMVMDRIGKPETALAVADSLGIDHSLVKTEIARNLTDIDVTLIVGADYQSLRLSLKD
jgi:hypothetical protein